MPVFLFNFQLKKITIFQTQEILEFLVSFKFVLAFFFLFLSALQATTLPHCVLRDVKEKFNISIKDSHQFKNGIEHLTYLCTDDKNQKIVIRIYRNRTPKFVELEANVLDQLSSDPDMQRVVVPMLKGKNNKKIQATKNAIYCLFNYIPGKHPKYLSSKQIKHLVSLINRMHRVGLRSWYMYKKRGIGPNYSNVKQSLEKFYSTGILKSHEFENLSNIIKNFHKVYSKYSLKTIIHYDIHKGNILLDKKEKIRLLDFDDFIVGSPLLDIVGMIRGLCILEQKEFNIELAKKIISYYNFTLVGENFNSNDLYICLLADLVRISNAFLERFPQNRRQSFLSIYKYILEVQSKKNLILRELSLFNTSQPKTAQNYNSSYSRESFFPFQKSCFTSSFPHYLPFNVLWMKER